MIAHGTNVQDDVLNLIAERFTENIRELEGALNRVTAMASLSGQPVTRAFIDQLRGVDSTRRYTKVVGKEDAEGFIHEKLLTHGKQKAEAEMDVILAGPNAKGRVVSRSVAQDESQQIFYPRMIGDAAGFGHVQCDSILMGNSKIQSIPAITANHPDAQLVHEAAIGRIAGDQILKLMTLGLTEEEAEEEILRGFLG